MKPFLIFIGCAGLAFAISLVSMLQLSQSKNDDSEPKPDVATPVGEEKKPKQPPPAKFPDDLAPVLRGQGVSQAKEYKAAATNCLVFLNKDGRLNEWQEKIDDEWRADTVEKTELVVVLGDPYKTAIAKQTYVDRFGKPAPPITRYQFGLEVSVHAARSGSLLASKRFVTQPPEFRKNVDYRVTALGQPVSCADVFEWVASLAQAGFSR